MSSPEMILRAAAELEELAAIAKDIVLDMRDDAQKYSRHDHAYARVYWFRARLTNEVVSKLGIGPPRDLAEL